MYEHIYIYMCMYCIYRDVDVCTYVFSSRCGLGGVEAPDVVFDFARVAAPEAPVRSPSSDATWDLARAFLRESRGGLAPALPCRVLRQRWRGI